MIGDIKRNFDDLKSWVGVVVGRFQNRAGKSLEDMAAGTLRLALKRKDIDPSSIKLLMQSERYVLHGITPEIADCSVKFPTGVSKDPADRIIAATSLVEKVALVTADNSLRHAKNIKTIW